MITEEKEEAYKGEQNKKIVTNQKIVTVEKGRKE